MLQGGVLNPLDTQGPRGDLKYAPCIHIFFFWDTQIEREFEYREISTKCRGTSAYRGASRNDAHPRPNLPRDYRTGTSTNKTFATPIGIKFIENILVGNIRSCFQVMESMLP